MTTIFLSVGDSGYNQTAVTVLIIYVILVIWGIGKIDWVQYFIPYSQKKRRRKRQLSEFEENFDNLRKRGVELAEYEKALQKRTELRNMVNDTKYGPFYRYGSSEKDFYEFDDEGNKVPDLRHIRHYVNAEGQKVKAEKGMSTYGLEPVYANKVKEPAPMGDRNELRVLLMGIFLVILFFYFIITSR